MARMLLLMYKTLNLLFQGVLWGAPQLLIPPMGNSSQSAQSSDGWMMQSGRYCIIGQ